MGDPIDAFSVIDASLPNASTTNTCSANASGAMSGIVVIVASSSVVIGTSWVVVSCAVMKGSTRQHPRCTRTIRSIATGRHQRARSVVGRTEQHWCVAWKHCCGDWDQRHRWHGGLPNDHFAHSCKLLTAGLRAANEIPESDHCQGQLLCCHQTFLSSAWRASRLLPLLYVALCV